MFDVLDDVVTAIPPHPLGVRPAGNAYTTSPQIKVPLHYLPEELIVQILEHLGVRALLNIGMTCKAFYAMSRLEDLWKDLCIKCPPSPFTWLGTWHCSYAGLSKNNLAKVSCEGLFSDVLYRPFLCAHTSLIPYTSNIPKQNKIIRLSDLSAEEFSTGWTDKPFILTGPVKKWPVYRNWSTSNLIERYGNISFRAEAVDWPLQTYIQYMNDTSDESPLYLFDRSFVEKTQIKVGYSEGEYWIPECFGEDYFAILGDERPDSRWLIVGPERSGSTFHKDPNATSAWNAVLRGSKYWIMFPSSSSFPPPPGVYVSEDQSEVTSPLSIAEWLLGFHAEARATQGCVEGICHEGEVLHVPSGWWHLVVNINPSIAITQNFVPQAHLENVLAFLKNKPDQVSGFKNEVEDPYGLFIERLKQAHPDVLRQALGNVELLSLAKKRKWDELVNGANESEIAQGEKKGFCFSFDDEEDNDDIP